jgi:hypothetical protein
MQQIDAINAIANAQELDKQAAPILQFKGHASPVIRQIFPEIKSSLDTSQSCTKQDAPSPFP